ncbi:PqiC family protein [Magnetococcus sp. PR-3]|uniref:PqiC family protein n=1 Tax=Magnetococcus sp. PR-3 TaxID=3120355 RepID=UPI002FCE0BF4
MRFILALGTLLLVSGCTTIVPLPSSQTSDPGLPLLQPLVTPGQPPASDGMVVTLRPIEIPDYLNRDEQVRRLEPGHTITLQDNPSWGESLSRGINRVIQVNLAHLLKSARVVRDDSYRHHPQGVTLKTELFRLEPVGDKVVLEARWHIFKKRTQPPLLSRWYRHKQPMAGQSATATLSAALGAMNRAQAEDLKEITQK